MLVVRVGRNVNETEKKTAAILLSIARQVEGEWVLVKILKAHTNPDKLYRYLRENTLPRAENIGGVDCVIEYGVIENVEIEEDSDSTAI
jgi:hypothetical protein